MYTLPASAYTLLVPLYNSPNRDYHNLNHIQFCLSKAEEYLKTKAVDHPSFWDEELSKEQEILVLAIWFHDAVYSPYPKALLSNEIESDALFSDWYYSNIVNSPNYNRDVYEAVSEAILCTQHHLSDLGPNILPTTKLMLDIDLAGFAKEFGAVYKDSTLVFNEYACLWVPTCTMMENRIKFLKALLSKERIFYTDYFYNKYESIARSNIEGVIELTLAELDK